MSRRLVGLEPLVNQYTRVLILGTFPGEESLRQREYYANPNNLFWKIMGDLLQQHLSVIGYDHRTQELLNKHIGIWDVVKSCRRTGSLDERIQDPTLNFFFPLKRLAPRLQKVCFNGHEAAKYAGTQTFEDMGYKVAVLPSTSPANAGMSYPEKLAKWRSGIFNGVGHF
jgi:hypoxanthine-DNA glycosylase